MGRKKIIDSCELVRLIEEYFDEVCGNKKKLKYGMITDYVKANGYPNFQVYTLQKDELAKKKIAELKAIEDEDVLELIAYKTIDVNKFVEEHQSRAQLIAGLTSLNNYYKKVSGSAVNLLERVQKAESEKEVLKKNKAELEEKLESLEKKYEKVRLERNEYKEKSQGYKKTLDRYVYPEVTNKLLKEQGINYGDSEHVKEEAEILEHNNIISFKENLFKIFEEDNDE